MYNKKCSEEDPGSYTSGTVLAPDSRWSNPSSSLTCSQEEAAESVEAHLPLCFGGWWGFLGRTWGLSVKNDRVWVEGGREEAIQDSEESLCEAGSAGEHGGPWNICHEEDENEKQDNAQERRALRDKVEKKYYHHLVTN